MIKKIFEYIKGTKVYKFFDERNIATIIIFFGVVVVISLLLLGKANKNMVEYTDRFATEAAVDSLQKLNTVQADSLKHQDYIISLQIQKLWTYDSNYVKQIYNERSRFEIYKTQQYEKINLIHNLGSSELQRQYADFEE